MVDFISRSLHTEEDPYCEAIGGIDFNQAEQSFVVSGYTESVRTFYTRKKASMFCLAYCSSCVFLPPLVFLFIRSRMVKPKFGLIAQIVTQLSAVRVGTVVLLGMIRIQW
jgi:hypothetical protein